MATPPNCSDRTSRRGLAQVLRLFGPDARGLYVDSGVCSWSSEPAQPLRAGKKRGGAVPRNVEEFRAQVPLTTYDDYLLSRDGPTPRACSRTYVWARTSAVPRSTPASGRPTPVRWSPRSASLLWPRLFWPGAARVWVGPRRHPPLHAGAPPLYRVRSSRGLVQG